jgi:hypothetical protein
MLREVYFTLGQSNHRVHRRTIILACDESEQEQENGIEWLENLDGVQLAGEGRPNGDLLSAIECELFRLDVTKSCADRIHARIRQPRQLSSCETQYNCMRHYGWPFSRGRPDLSLLKGSATRSGASSPSMVRHWSSIGLLLRDHFELDEEDHGRK